VIEIDDRPPPVPAPPADRPGPELGDGFETLFRAEYPTMVRLAAMLGADDPENIASEAFVKLHEKWARIDAAAAGGYLRVTVVNLTRSRHRHLRVVARWTRQQRDEVVDAADIAVQRVAAQRVWDALDALPPRSREAVVLRYWLDLSERDIATAMGIAAGTVKSHVSRAVSMLRERLTELPGLFDGPSPTDRPAQRPDTDRRNTSR
jgi:RNA polymerase sigma-70 factor (sigma-E family)